MYYIFTLIIGFALGWIFSTQKRKVSFISKQKREKEQGKQAIFELLETNHPLTNNDVEAMLGISDATATRYLEQLEKEGKTKQEGGTGQGVAYVKIN